jgi:hypothetical protein
MGKLSRRVGLRWQVGALALGALVSSSLGACGESPSPEDGSDDLTSPDDSAPSDDGAPTDDGLEPDGGLSPGDGSGGGGGAAPSECQNDSQCASSSVCHPIQKVCVAEGASCETQDQCGAGTFCDAASQHCLPGLSGSACATSDNCAEGSTCSAGVCQCAGFQREQETVSSPLDIYFMFDRTGSMGRDCEYENGETAPVDSKACFATYAMADYLTSVTPSVDTRLAFQFMSYKDGCDGAPYSQPLVDFTELPLPVDHALIQAISDETFRGGWGTQIEGALIGISAYTTEARSAGREMIGVLMTDGDPEGCDENIDNLAQIIRDHLEATGIRTFIIGMEGATESNLEQLALAGGADPHSDFCGGLEPPCHYWNVGNGSGDAIQSALTAIAGQATPFPCKYDLDEVGDSVSGGLDLDTLNVQLSQNGDTTLIGKVAGESNCPAVAPAWYFDSNATPNEVILCKSACDLVTAAESGATLSIVGGCSETVIFE